MEISPAGQGLHAPGRDQAVPGRSSHSATDAMLVAVGGVAFACLTRAHVDHHEAVRSSLALVAGLKAVVTVPTWLAVGWSKVRRFLHS
ncbi:hypothetical protein ACWCXC_31580 [Streptomyces sp. NPDC001515]